MPLTADEAADEVYGLLGVSDLSAATRARYAAWYDAANATGNGWSIRGSSLMLALLSPDFQLA